MKKNATGNKSATKKHKKPLEAPISINPAVKAALRKKTDPQHLKKLPLKQIEELLAFYTLPECKAISALVNSRINYLSSEIRPESHIDDLGLSFRANSILVRNKLLTVAKILDYGLDNLWHLDGAGNKSIEEIKQALGKMDR